MRALLDAIEFEASYGLYAWDDAGGRVTRDAWAWIYLRLRKRLP